MNLGQHYDYGTRTITIPGYKLGDANIVATRLLNAIKNSVEAVNEQKNADSIKILHEKSGIFLEVKNSHGNAQQQTKNLVTEALEHLKKPASDGKIPEYNATLSREIKSKIMLDGEDLEIKNRGLNSSRLDRMIKKQSANLHR